MPNSFDRVTHSLNRDHGRLPIAGLVIAALLLFGWLAWALLARITRYEVSDSARLEVDRATYPVEASTSGRLVSSFLLLGREVHAGEILA